MVLIVTADPDLATQLLEIVPEEKAVFLAREPPESQIRDEPLEMTPRRRGRKPGASKLLHRLAEERAVKCHNWLRHNIYARQPRVVLLDVTLGGSSYRAVESVPKIIEAKSSPMVVLVIPFESPQLENEAVRLGCFDVVSRSASSFREDVLDVLAAAQVARASHAAPSAPKPSRRQMH